MLAIFVIAVAILLGVSNQMVGAEQNTNGLIALSFVLGAFCSGLAGYFGMKTATGANIRTASAARKGLNEALQVAFTGGSVMGLSVVGLALTGLGGLFILYTKMYPAALTDTGAMALVLNILSGFSLGASSIALFARVGGGIYTKAADVGADLVGKVEAGIPEDHPLNPATIADNVGDNVGDVAGMGADLFESYIGAIISSMILGAAWFAGLEAAQPGTGMNAVYLPLAIAIVGIIASIIGFFFVRTKEGGNPQTGLNMGTFGAGALMVVGTVAAIKIADPGGRRDGQRHHHRRARDLPTSGGASPTAVIAGLAAGIAVGLLTEYYTATEKKPVGTIVEASKTGPATTIIQGIAVGMNSTTFPVLVIGAAILIAYRFAGLYGIALAALGMLSHHRHPARHRRLRPIADNAGGVAEMARLGRDIRARTDKLDAVGNTTAAIGKGFAIGSAALTALALTAAFLTKMQGNVEHRRRQPLRAGRSAHRLHAAVPLLGHGHGRGGQGRAGHDPGSPPPVPRHPRVASGPRGGAEAESEEREPNAEEAKIIAAADGKAEYTQCVEISTAGGDQEDDRPRPDGGDRSGSSLASRSTCWAGCSSA